MDLTLLLAEVLGVTVTAGIVLVWWVATRGEKHT